MCNPLIERTARSLTPSPVKSRGIIECIGYCKLCSHNSLVAWPAGAVLSNLYANIFWKKRSRNFQRYLIRFITHNNIAIAVSDKCQKLIIHVVSHKATVLEVKGLLFSLCDAGRDR